MLSRAKKKMGGRSIQLALILSRIPGTWKKILVCLNVRAYLVKC